MENSDPTISTRREPGVPPRKGRKLPSHFRDLPACREGLLKEQMFHAMLVRERRRAERSRRPIVLVLLDFCAVSKKCGDANFIEQLTCVLADETRETDIIGWYEQGLVLGVIFTELNLEGKSPIADLLYTKVVDTLRDNLDQETASSLAVSVHLIPESWDIPRRDREADIRCINSMLEKPQKNDIR